MILFRERMKIMDTRKSTETMSGDLERTQRDLESVKLMHTLVEEYLVNRDLEAEI